MPPMLRAPKINPAATTLLGACYALLAGHAVSADLKMDYAPQLWVNPGLYSHHFDSSKGYRSNNIGFGGEVLISKNHGAVAGSFINSDRARSHYVGYQWRPLHWQPTEGLHVSGNVIVAAFDGYPRMRDGGWFAAALPVVAVEGKRVGANFTIVPNYGNRLHGAVAVQVKLRVW